MSIKQTQRKQVRAACFLLNFFIQNLQNFEQGASVLMAPFIKNLPSIQSSILIMKTHKDIGRPCFCGSGLGQLYRCHECFNSRMFCGSCIVSAHIHSAFHHIQKWVETHFVRSSLKEVGLTISLGHFGVRCPNLSTTSCGRPTTIVHTNGMHETIVEYCHCLEAPSEPFQLIKAGLFPSTLDQPMTAFTFEVLRNFEKHVLAFKKSAYDYCDALWKLTDSAFPQNISVSCKFDCKKTPQC